MPKYDAQTMHSIHYFWFGKMDSAESAPTEERLKLWFGFSPELDKQIKAKYSEILEEANKGNLDEWTSSSQGCLVLLILLDQFSRQIYRKTERAFAYDSKALEIAKYAVNKELDKNMHFCENIFCYLPFEHSEDKKMQEQSVYLYSKLLNRASEAQYEAASKCLKMANDHKKIIDLFGRFPHRNEALNRRSTEEEIKYLASEYSSYGQ